MSPRDTIASCALRSIQRGVCFLDPFECGLLRREFHDADADRHVRPRYQSCVLHQSAEILGNEQRLGEACSGQQQDEFFAARAEQRVDLADSLSHQRDQRFQNAISLSVPECVVDVFESIDVEHQNRGAFTRSASPLDRRRKGGVHLPPVVCAGQRIGVHLLFEQVNPMLKHRHSDYRDCRDRKNDQVDSHGSGSQKARDVPAWGGRTVLVDARASRVQTRRKATRSIRTSQRNRSR